MISKRDSGHGEPLFRLRGLALPRRRWRKSERRSTPYAEARLIRISRRTGCRKRSGPHPQRYGSVHSSTRFSPAFSLSFLSVSCAHEGVVDFVHTCRPYVTQRNNGESLPRTRTECALRTEETAYDRQVSFPVPPWRICRPATSTDVFQKWRKNNTASRSHTSKKATARRIRMAYSSTTSPASNYRDPEIDKNVSRAAA